MAVNPNPSTLDAHQIVKRQHDSDNDAQRVHVIATTSASAAEKTDDATFTPGTSVVMMIGAEADEVAPDSVNEGDAGAIRMSLNRNLYTQIRDSAGNERGVNVTASNELNVLDSNSGAIKTSVELIDDSIATTGAAIPSKGIAISGTDGTNARIVKTDASGELQIDVLSSALPTGAATLAEQQTQTTSLQLLDDVVATTAAAIPGKGYAVSGTDGTNARILKTDASGELQVDVLTQPAISHTTDSIKIGDGTDLALVTAAGELNVLETNSGAIKTAVEIMDDWDESDRAKVNPIVGSAGVQGGSGVVTANTQRVVLATDVALPAGTNAIGKLSANDGVDIGDVTINNASGASAVNIQDGGNSITVDGTVAATQSGTWNVRAQDGSGNALTSTTVGSHQALDTQDVGFVNSEFIRNDYSSVNVTTSAYTELIASTTNEYKEIHIFDSSGQTLKLATGAAASEVDKIIIPPGGTFPTKLRIASGTRISIRAISANATTGEITVQFLG